VLSVWRVRQAVQAPICGVGGIASAEDALQYLMAGATLVGVGTAALRDPRAPERIVRGLARWCAREGVASLDAIIGSLAEGPA
jgi:dihydroorotate dehydrogenase (NAD+) catalytic subunit